jgi:hypothetical protein
VGFGWFGAACGFAWHRFTAGDSVKDLISIVVVLGQKIAKMI